MMDMNALLGVSAYIAAIAGINVFTLFFLLLSKWWKDFMSFSILAFFVIIAGVLDLSASARFFPESIHYIEPISTPILIVLATASWTLVGTFIYVNIIRPLHRKRKPKKVDVTIQSM